MANAPNPPPPKNAVKPPPPPPPPPKRILKEDGTCGYCPICHSSMIREKFFFFGKKKCIQPQCGYEE